MTPACVTALQEVMELLVSLEDSAARLDIDPHTVATFHELKSQVGQKLQTRRLKAESFIHARKRKQDVPKEPGDLDLEDMNDFESLKSCLKRVEGSCVD
jgi:hypothetical protein